MTDVATLGLKVESSAVEKGTQALNQLSGAAARAEAAANGLSSANRGATGAASAAAKAYATEGAAAASASKQIEMMNRAANQNGKGAGGRGNVANIAAQFQDIAVSAQMGMGPMQIALQQGTQLAAVLSTLENPVKGLGEAFLSVLSPVSLVTIAVIALVAALLQFVNWSKLAQSALIAVAEVLEPIAPYAVAAAAALTLIYAPAIIGGIVSLIALLGRLVVQLGIVAGAFALANPVVAFVAGIAAAVAAANFFRDELTQIFGRDIVAEAKNGVNAVIGAFLGGYEAIKAVWANLPAAISDFVYSTAKKVIDGIESMVQKAIDGLNNLINKYALWTASIGQPLSPETYNSMIIPPVEFGHPENPNPGAAGAAMRAAQDAYNSAQGTDYVGKGIEAIGEYASTAAGKIKDLAKGLTEVDAKSKKRAGKSDLEKYDDIVKGAERQIVALEAERDALGLTAEAAAALRYETQFLNEAQQRGISLTDAQKSELSALAQVMASVEAETVRMGEAIEVSKMLTHSFFDDFFAGIERGKSVWESFGDAALGVLDRIADKLLTDVIDAVFQVGNAGKGGGGLLGLLGGLFSSGKTAVDPWAGLRGYASGTSSARPGVAWVGEKGPELVRFKGGEEVVPNHRIQRPANQNAGNPGGETTIHAPVKISIDARGADREGTARIEQQIAKLRSELPGVVVDTVKNAQKRRVL